MAARSSWSGYLKVSLVSVPVKAYTAASSGGASISLNQLHEECHSRIKYQKVCPIHGEVSNDEIVSGYEYAKNQYAIIDTAELEKLRPEGDKSINVETFIAHDALDPIFQTDSTYYLVPDGPVGQKPYALLRDAMEEEGLHAIGQVVMSNKERLVRIHPMGDMLAMTVLRYEADVKQPSAFEDELISTDNSPQELKLTRQLLSGMRAKNFDFSQYTDVYTQRLTELIQAKVVGQELVAPPAHEAPQVINLMEALKASVERVGAPQVAAEKPTRERAASKTTRTAKKAAASTTAKKRKSG